MLLILNHNVIVKLPNVTYNSNVTERLKFLNVTLIMLNNMLNYVVNNIGF